MEVEQVSQKTIKLCKNAFCHFRAVYGDSYDIHNIDSGVVRKMQRYLHTQGRSAATSNIYLRQLQRAFERLIPDIINHNPFYRFKRLPEHKGRSMTVKEQETFLTGLREHPNEDFKRILRLYIAMGLRRSEILNIDRDNVDLTAGTFQAVNIKSEDKHLVDRDIPENLWTDFKYFMDKYPDKQYPFRICHPDSMTHKVKDFLREIGLSEDLHLHSCRHTLITRMVEAGDMTIREIQKWVDHKKHSTTERYAHDKPKKTPKMEL